MLRRGALFDGHDFLRRVDDPFPSKLPKGRGGEREREWRGGERRDDEARADEN